MKMPDKIYTIMKIGNKKNPENYNQPTQFAMTGKLRGGELKIGDSAVVLSHNSSEWFHTSRVRSLYIHESDSGFDKLILPKDFPISEDLVIPELKSGDALIGTMNSVYLLTEERKDIKNNY